MDRTLREGHPIVTAEHVTGGTKAHDISVRQSSAEAQETEPVCRAIALVAPHDAFVARLYSASRANYARLPRSCSNENGMSVLWVPDILTDFFRKF
jgi:hypothetical protein